MNDIVRDFLLESHESLAQLDLDLVTLEQEPGERETLARVFRTIHTVKGTAGFLGLAKLQNVSHAAETLLGRLRAGELTFTAEIAGALLGVVDAIRQMLAQLEATEQEGDGDYSAHVRALEQLTRDPGSSRARKPQEPVPDSPAPAPAPPEPPRAAPGDEEPRAPHISDTSVRVDTGLLDTLMTLVGELVLARNQIVQFNRAQEGTAYHSAVQRLNTLTTELQAGVTKTRMQPIGNLWAKFPRLVRDLAVACGKQVRLELEGHDTELDRSIIEAVRDPLTHMVRNAVDHGIEPPAGRAAAGKPAEGRVRLHAFHEGGKVVIEITDDGAGIDPVRVRDKALAAQLIAPDRAAAMTERELLRLVFLPGFSTADRVSPLSGRGVGMDVVRTNIEKIGGTVDLDSQRGLGTTLRMRIPLTLAIVPALIVTTGGDRYAIPQVNLIELLRIDGAVTWGAVENVYGAPVYRLRDALLPLVYLHRVLGVDPADAPGDALHVVVVQADDYRFGLVVDAIHDTEEIVVKPLQKPLKPVGVFAGATIMGDGQVALILDVPGVGQRARAAGRGSRTGASRLAGWPPGPRPRTGSSCCCSRPGPPGRAAWPSRWPASRGSRSSPRGGRTGRGPRGRPVPRRGPAAGASRAGLRPAPNRYPPAPCGPRRRPAPGRRVRVGPAPRRARGGPRARHRGRGDHRPLAPRPRRHPVQRRRPGARHRVPGRGPVGPRRGGGSVVTAERQFCTVHLAGHVFGIDVMKIQEVVRVREMTRVPLAPPVVVGLMNLRGEIVTVLDLRRRFGLPEPPPGLVPLNVVVRTDEGPISLLVDDVGDVFLVPESAFEELPETLRGLPAELLSGVYKLDGQLLLVLDTRRAVSLDPAPAR
ncbi:Signal transduction histidine kinase CheA [Frigoriglobus tundricola]|uniref:histidine kinase n=1 Tax=Frigoriglobus tundricola TaxID=2774151 RepID=A0A6M5YJ80_9BACT|nr:chemotaxis protein CheW [Frigoriglobus tundricola]QJW93614.1 Signal transduction histidine kinase CheA [Frigoriglobus tundricola]